jgi:LysM repeat protein
VFKKSLTLLIASLCLMLLVGCNATPQETLLPTTNTQTPAIRPFYTQTPLQTAAPTTTQAPTPTLPPLPTPTPYMYTIVAGDTMIGIAIYFGITYDELSLANPEVNPNFLSVGTQLIIPLPQDENGDAGSEGQAVPELLPLQTGEVNCSPVSSGGLWCYWSVTNQLDVPAENIAGVIRLLDNAGEESASQPAHSLLNLLAPGRSMPMAAYFAPPVPAWSTVQGQLTSAVEANQAEIRYQAGDIQNLQTVPLEDNPLGYQISGSLNFSNPVDAEGTALGVEYAWVLAIGYDADGAVVGVRRWEASSEQIEGTLTFSLEVFSLGKPIEAVEVLSEIKTSNP